MALSGVWTADFSWRKPFVTESLVRMAPHGANLETASAGDVTLGVADGASLFTSTSAHTAAFDGDIYDRPALLSQLSPKQSALGTTNAHLLSLAYQKWGESLIDEIDGEFAFAVWDHAQRKLILGRDAMGRRSLYYGRTGSALIFATEASALFAFLGMQPMPDDITIVRTMNTRYQPGRTIFQGIRYPPPAHHVILQAGKPDRLVKFWYPEDQPMLRVRDPREYAEALHAALLRAVEVRLPSEGLVATQLSAGYDSSGVTALAAQALARQNRSLLAYTSVPTHPSDASAVMRGWFADEWPLAHQVATMYPNIEHIAVPTGGASWINAIDATTQLLTGPPCFIRNCAWVWDMYQRAQARGAVIMFNGQSGNLTSSYDGGFSLFNLRRRHDWAGLARAIAWRRRKGRRWRGLLFDTLLPTASVQSTWKRLSGKPTHTFYEHCLIRPEFYRSTGVPELADSPMGLTPAGDRRTGATWRFSILHLLDAGSMASADRRLYGMRRADPTADRRVVELCLSIPDEAYLMGERPRSLYREAMRGALPEDVLQHRGGGLQSSDFLENFRAGIDDFRAEMALLHHSPSADRVLDLPRMQAMLDQFPADLTANRGELDLRYNYTFGGALAMGRFLRKLESGQLDWIAPPA